MAKINSKNKKRKKNKFCLVIMFFLIILIVLELFFIKGNLSGFIDKAKDIHSNKIDEDKIKVVDINSDSRSIAVMINNHNSARPYHMGLQDAYLIYEVIVEGGSTRYMAIYKDKDIDKIGSVRSARHYFLDYVLENDAIFVHWGWSDQAKDDISNLGIDNINGLFYEDSYFYRDRSLNVSLEHTGFTNTNLINKGIDKMKYRNTTNKKLLLNYSMEEIDLSQLSGAVSANDLDFKYSGVITTSYKYDESNKKYLRFVNGKEHTDYVSKKQYDFKNIIVYQVSNHTLNGDVKGRQEIDNIGSGKGYFISDGYAVPIKWNKKSRSSQTVYTLEDGTEIKVNDGNTFIQIVPTNGKIVIS